MMKVLITDKLAREGIDIINAADGVEAVVKTGISEDELASIIGEYDGLIIRSDTKVTAKVLANPGKLKGVARAGVGVDNIDVKEATRKGILVMNTPGGNTLSAAEHTMALMLAMSRNVVPACNSLKSGAWDRKKYTGNQLNRKVLGLIGLGRIGMAVAQMARGFNMKVLGFDPLSDTWVHDRDDRADQALDAVVRHLLAQRATARAERDFAAADAIHLGDRATDPHRQ